MVQNPVRAVFWHCTHEKYVSLGSARMTLPLLWWRGQDDDRGGITLKHAAIDYRLSFVTSDLRLIPLRPEVTIRDDDAAEKAQGLWTKTLNGKGGQDFVPIVIAAPAGKIFCTRDRTIPEFSSFLCFSYKTRWKMWFGPGSIQEESEAESILGSLK